MKTHTKILSILFPLLMMSNVCHSKSDFNLEKTLKSAGSSYRGVLLKNGWKPVISCPENKQPEFYNCSASGLCNSFWKKDGKYLSVGTSGEITRKVYMVETAKPSLVKEESTHTDQCDRLKDYGDL